MMEDFEAARLLAEVTAEIVSAYVSNNKIAPGEVAALITTVASQMAMIGTAAPPPVEAKAEPAVPARRSIQPDFLLCLVCGKAQKVLKRHLGVKHGLTPAGYRERFELKPDYPMIAPNYALQRREVALKLGLGRPKPGVRRSRTGKPLGRPRKVVPGQAPVPGGGA